MWQRLVALGATNLCHIRRAGQAGLVVESIV